MKPLQRNKDLIAPCGVYCGACSSYLRGTCLGCRSDSIKQKRVSKWSCRVRYCTLHQKQLIHCGECPELVCKSYERKLLAGHAHDVRYNYRFEAVENLLFLRHNPINVLLDQIQETYTCPECGSMITFFEYHCTGCHYGLLS